MASIVTKSWKKWAGYIFLVNVSGPIYRRLIMRITLGLALCIETMIQGAEIMGQVVHIVIHLMMNEHLRVWGEACYPVVD
jgi:hypothetical protein